MNLFKELNRISNYRPIRPWFEQSNLTNVKYGIDIKADLINLSPGQVIYVPCCINDRRVSITKKSFFELFDMHYKYC